MVVHVKNELFFLAMLALSDSSPAVASEPTDLDDRAVSSARAEVELRSRDIRLSDLAVVADGAADPIVARLPRGANRLDLTAHAAKRIIRHRLPMQRTVLSFEDTITLRAAPDASATRSGDCFAATTRFAKGEFISAMRVEKAPCQIASDKSEEEKALIGYDRDARAPVAQKDVPRGAYLGAIRPITDRRLAKNAEALLVTGTRAVTITRSVTTMQAGREGRSVLVRTLDGEFFTVPVSHLSEDLAP